jgi:beta-lactamase regulating signal transducer with metallopeptidase domain
VERLLQIGLSNAAVSAGLALLAVAMSRVLRRPALAHALWVLVLLKLITPPLHIIPIEWPAMASESTEIAASESPARDEIQPVDLAAPEVPNEAAEEMFILADDVPVGDLPAGPEQEPESAPPSLTGFSWPALILAVWATGSIGWLGLATVRLARFQRLLRHGRPATAAVQAQARDLASRLGLTSCPGIWMVPGRVSPMLWALVGKPRLLLPAELWRALPEEQRATLLAHELAHRLRLDHWVRRLELAVTCLYWWHPVVWWARRELREAEEQCCDAWVVWALPLSAKDYALALVETLDFLSVARPVLPVAASGVGHIHDLRRRLTMIMRGTTPRRLTWTGFAAVLGMAALLLPVLPTWAQAPGPRDGGGDPRGVQPLPGQPGGGERRADVEKARAELAVAEAELAKARAQVAQADARLKAAQARLAEVQGRRQGGAQRFIIIIKDDQGREIRRIEIPADGRQGMGMQGGGGFGVIRVDQGGGGVVRGGMGGLGGGMFGGGGSSPPRGAPADNDRRIKDLEKKLDDILRQLENLRQQIRPGERRPDGQRQPTPRPREGAGADNKDGEIIIRQLDMSPDVLKQIEEAIRQLQKEGKDREKKKLEDVLRELQNQRRKAGSPEGAGDKKPDPEIKREIIIEREKRSR